MKQRLITFLEGAILAFFLGFCAIGCLCTAFSLPLIDLWLLVLLCALTAVLGGFCYCFGLWLVPMGVLALAAGFLWQSGMLENGLEALLYRISAVYHGGYHWSIIQWSGASVAQMDASLPGFIYLLGILLTLATVWTVCRGKSCLWACLPALVPVLACFVVTDTLPSLPLLFAFMAVFLILMFSSHSRQVDTRQANRLTAMVALPVMLALGLLFLAVPEQTYQGQAQARTLCQTLFGESPLERLWDQVTGQTSYTGTSVDGASVDLTRVGIRVESYNEVMRVNTRYTGKLYLRGRALDGYSGTQWYDTGDTDWFLSWPDTTTMDYVGSVTITTKYAHQMLYVPYYVRNLNSQSLYRGMMNEDRLSMYSFSVCLPPDSTVLRETYRLWKRDHAGSEYSQEQLSHCTDLPESTKKWAQELLAQILDENMDHYQMAQQIGSYVRNSASYDLQTRRMPGRQTDFARWFLESSDTGYCVHFASAATVLLKAAGIPARYVTGYTIHVEDGKTAVVRGEHAHAWAEYWLPGYGWTILEATPAEEEASQEQTSAPTQEPTAAPTAPTSPRQDPSDPDTPWEETVPGANDRDGHWDAKVLLPVLWWLLGITGAVAVLLGQWRLRLHLRLRRFAKGSTNEKVLARWQDTAWLCRVQKRTPPRELFELAQKAKFSQHTITQEELILFVSFREAAIAQLKKQALFKRFYYRVILAVY